MALLHVYPIAKPFGGVAMAPPHKLRPNGCRPRAASSNEQLASAEDILRAADDLISKVTKGELPKKAAHPQPLEAPPPGLTLHCDVNGCTIVPVASDTPSAAGPAGSFVGSSGQQTNGAPQDWHSTEGQGWMLGFDRSPASPEAFSALIGADTWSIALSAAEFADFVKLLRNLRQSVATLDVCGEWRADAAEATLEMSTERVWMQGRAPTKRLSALQELWQRRRSPEESSVPAAFSLRFIITSPGQREVQGCWSPEVVMRVLQHLDAEVPAEERAAASALAFAAAYAG